MMTPLIQEDISATESGTDGACLTRLDVVSPAVILGAYQAKVKNNLNNLTKPVL
jgi:hypothetical protein